ncbi:hypothetical protein BS333_08130 [Vibrio azureus]|nr:hypothetical protein BS333_08130 [Vibrio azureus]
MFSTYKIVLFVIFFKEQSWDDLWITIQIKKNSKWILTDEKRADLIREKGNLKIGLEITACKNIFLDLYRFLFAKNRLVKNTSRCLIFINNSRENSLICM